MDKVIWNEKASSLLKNELAKKEIDYADLAELLNKMGLKETYNSIASKVSRGTFSMAFFLQCMEAIGNREVRL